MLKVVRQTERQLVLDRRPWILGIGIGAFTLVFVGIGLAQLLDGEIVGGLMFGVAGGGIGFLAFWAFVRRTMVILDRDAGSVTIRRKGIGGFTEEAHRLDEVEGATVETSSGDDNDTHRPALVIRGRSVPLTLVYVLGGGARRVAGVVNDWLGTPDADRPRRRTG